MKTTGVRLFTKYTLAKSRTAKLSMIKRIQKSKDPDPEEIRFLDLVIENEKDAQIRQQARLAKKSLSSKTDNISFRKGRSTTTTADISKASTKISDCNHKNYVNISRFAQKNPVELNRELKRRLKQNSVDDFFRNTPIVSRLRKDLMETVRSVVSEAPVSSFVISPGLDFSELGEDYSPDLLVINRVLKPEKSGFRKGLLANLRSYVPELYYILGVLTEKTLFLFARGSIEWTHFYYLTLDLAMASDCYIRDDGLYMVMKNNDVLILPDLDQQAADDVEIAFRLFRIMRSKEDFAELAREKKKLSTLLSARIIKKDDYARRLERFGRIWEKVFSDSNIETILANLVKKGKASEGVMDFLIKEKGRLLCLLFSDIVGYSEKSQEIGTIRMMGLLTLYERAGEECAQKFNGRLVKKIGDGLLMTFEDAKQAAEASCFLHSKIEQETKYLDKDMWFRIRICLNRGTVFVKQNDVFGDPVNLLSRIEKAAGPGETVCTKEFADAAKRGVKYRKLGRKKVKGFKEEIELFLLLKE